MGFHVNAEQFDTWLTEQQKTHDIYAPNCFAGGNTFSDVDCIRYGKVSSISEIVFDRKSEYSFKEVLTPISQTLFFFTEEQCKKADPPKKGAIIFLRSCDLHALKRLDDLYLHNGPADYYYKRIRDNIKIVLMGCKHSFESCFCVSMGTNFSENYDMSINVGDGVYELNCKDSSWNRFFLDIGAERHLVVPDQVHENQTVVKIPEHHRLHRQSGLSLCLLRYHRFCQADRKGRVSQCPPFQDRPHRLSQRLRQGSPPRLRHHGHDRAPAVP